MLSHTLLPSVAAAALGVFAIASTAAPLDKSSPRTDAHVVQLQRRAFEASKYPPGMQSPPQSSLPSDWVSALHALEQGGHIPNIPQSFATDAGVSYPNGAGDHHDTCSWTTSKCYGERDIRDVPDNHWLISFDDGPTGVSGGLYDFLHSHNQAGTHFMIGSQILQYPDQVQHAMQTSQQPAVHTWSHSLQTTKSNMEVLGELGWTMQIIYDIAGVVPKYWRPPQGDVDNRVRAIAEGVFNLTTIMWSHECNDWCLQEDGSSSCPGEQPGDSMQSVEHAVQQALHAPKSPGVSLLEHELTSQSVGVFERYYPNLRSMGWNPVSVPDSFGVDWYQNAPNNDERPVNVSSMLYSTVARETSKEDESPPRGANATLSSGRQNSVSNSTSKGSSTPAADHYSKSGAPRLDASIVTLAFLAAASALGMGVILL